MKKFISKETHDIYKVLVLDNLKYLPFNDLYNEEIYMISVLFVTEHSYFCEKRHRCIPQ